MKVYLSSTFKDLAEHRRLAYRAMRSLGLDVVAMEDYVARDERPADRCLSDVASADLYVGLFGFRYGYVPEEDNPEGRSVTELEFRQAVHHKVPRLVFVARPGQWDVSQVDAVTGDGDKGTRISRLREELTQDAMVGWFTTPDQLEAEVTKGVSVWLFENGTAPAGYPARRLSAPHPRQLDFDVLLLHAAADRDRAMAIAAAVSAIWSVQVSTTGGIIHSSHF